MSDTAKAPPGAPALISIAEDSEAAFRLEMKDRRLGRIIERFTARRFLVEPTGVQSGYFWQHRASIGALWPTPSSLEGGNIEDLRSAPWERIRALWEPYRGRTYSIQFDSNRRLRFPIQALLEEFQARLDLPREKRSDRRPEVVITVFWTCQPPTPRLMVGVSPILENVSPWNAGICRIPRSPESLSRAESKLLEGWEAFSMPFPESGDRALDLGAAPGGWSRVLAEMGYGVDAVDPADLSERVGREPRIVHYRTTAGNFLNTHSSVRYKILVSDMKMSAERAAELLGRFRLLLEPGGLLLTTFKLAAGTNGYLVARAAVQALSENYEIRSARQLYFNRKEITVLARRVEL